MQIATAPSLQRNYRIQSIDLLRGLVMVIMALDHTREFFHSSAQLYNPLDLSQTSAPIFLTRWITHFCAPVFVFLAGTSARFVGVRRGKRALSKFLLIRGIWLVFIEAIVMSFAFTFNWTFSMIFLETIWALGMGMIALSFLIWLPKRILLIVALLIIACHNLLDTVHVSGNGADAVGWSMLHEVKFFNFPPFQILVLYPALPWIGVMAAGYCFGELYTKFDAVTRKKMLIIIGCICIILFIMIRFTNKYGESFLWQKQNTPVFTLLSFINTTKYPPSLLFILMTLGPSILFLAFAEKPLQKSGNIISTYGKVPLFYFIIHFYIIHLAALITALISGFSIKDILNGNAGQLPGFGFPLWIVYLIWMSVVVIMYPLCKRYAKYKFDHPEKWWLSYL